MALNLILRTLTALGFTTKGAELTWAEFDTNMIKVGQAIDALQAAPEALILQGGYDCSSNPAYPDNTATLNGDNPQRGYAWYVTVAGTLHGIPVAAGQLFFAKIDNAGPGNDSQWVIVDSGFNFADLFKNYMMSLPNYDNTKIKALCTTGSGDNFEWRNVLEP